MLLENVYCLYHNMMVAVQTVALGMAIIKWYWGGSCGIYIKLICSCSIVAGKCFKDVKSVIKGKVNKASVYVSSCHLYLELVFFFLKAGNEEVPYSDLRTLLQKQALSCLPCQLKLKKTKKTQRKLHLSSVCLLGCEASLHLMQLGCTGQVICTEKFK